MITGRALNAIFKKYPSPRQFIRQNQRDKHDFNDRYIDAYIKRMKALKRRYVIPKKKAVISKRCGFWVDVN